MFVATLWLPIVLATIVVFFLSAAAWMALPHHRGDYGRLEKEDQLLDALKNLGVPAGRYMFPNAGSHANAQTEEFKKKHEHSPIGTITVFGKVNMGANMATTFAFFLVANILLAYLGWVALEGTKPDFMRVFRVVGTAAVLMYTCGSIPNDIWFKRPIVTNLIDGVVFGIVSGLIFASLWPAS
jgi:hypothetical protein